MCLHIEHSYLKDLQIELLTLPDSTGLPRVIILDKRHDRDILNETSDHPVTMAVRPPEAQGKVAARSMPKQ